MTYKFLGASDENGAKKIERQLEEIQDKNSNDFDNVDIKVANRGGRLAQRWEQMGRQVTQKSLPKQFLIDNQLNVADFKLLGAGTFGAVYSARRFDGTEVIVKISSLTRKPDIEKNDEGALISPIATTLFANELIMENEVYNKFPSFLPKPQESMIYSTGQDEEKEVFGVQIQSKVNGENLLSFMQRNDVPLSEKIQTITRTLSLIAAINSQGIEHGDYHFGNIMYDRDNKTISAIDWACARSKNAGVDRGHCEISGLSRDAYEFLKSLNVLSSHLSGSDLQEPAQQADFDSSMVNFNEKVETARNTATSRGVVLHPADISRFWNRAMFSYCAKNHVIMDLPSPPPSVFEGNALPEKDYKRLGEAQAALKVNDGLLCNSIENLSEHKFANEIKGIANDVDKNFVKVTSNFLVHKQDEQTVSTIKKRGIVETAILRQDGVVNANTLSNKHQVINFIMNENLQKDFINRSGQREQLLLAEGGLVKREILDENGKVISTKVYDRNLEITSDITKQQRSAIRADLIRKTCSVEGTKEEKIHASYGVLKSQNSIGAGSKEMLSGDIQNVSQLSKNATKVMKVFNGMCESAQENFMNKGLILFANIVKLNSRSPEALQKCMEVYNASKEMASEFEANGISHAKAMDMSLQMNSANILANEVSVAVPMAINLQASDGLVEAIGATHTLHQPAQTMQLAPIQHPWF